MDSVFALAVRPDGATFAALDCAGTIKLWNLDTGTKIYTLAENSIGSFCFAVSRDGQIIATGGSDCGTQTMIATRNDELWNLEARERFALF